MNKSAIALLLTKEFLNLEYVENKKTTFEIAGLTDISERTIRTYIKKYGLYRDYLRNRKNTKLTGKYKYRKVGNISERYWKQIVSNSTRRKFDFDINTKYLWDLYLQQDKKCAISGQDIFFEPLGTRDIFRTVSLDRIDNSKGYIKGNVQWLHKDVNKIKSDMTTEKLISLCIIIAQNNLEVIK